MHYEKDRVVIDMSRDDFDMLLLVLGLAAGGQFDDRVFFWRVMKLANTINEGNPRYTPYEIPEEYRLGGTNG